MTQYLDYPVDMRWDVREIFERGEYDLPGLEFNRPPSILDIGANIGAYATWAGTRWPGCTVTCYEPNPKALEYLHKNKQPHMTVVEAAVTSRDTHEVTLYQGSANLGQAGLYPLPEGGMSIANESCIVRNVQPKDLLQFDMVKIDTEGCEHDILSHYDLSGTSVVCFEYHRRGDRGIICDLLEAEGFTLVGGVIRNAWLGTLKFIREDACKNG